MKKNTTYMDSNMFIIWPDQEQQRKTLITVGRI